MIPDWAGRYIGLPYADKGRGPDAWDCWGGVRMVMSDVFGLNDLPDYREAYATAADFESVSAAIAAGLADGWSLAEKPREGDLLSLKIGGRPWHCGVMVNVRQFLHWPPPDKHGRQLLSCIERLDAPHWSRRIDGIYRRDLRLTPRSPAHGSIHHSNQLDIAHA